MTDRYFIEDQKLVKQLLKSLTPLDENSGWQCELYVDKATGQKWEKYLFELFDEDEDGIGLRKYPYPSTEEIIRIALTSQHFDEVDGASALLIDREYDKIEFREKLLSEIEKDSSKVDKERYEIIYNRAELYDITNKREILGKHYKEIEADAKHFTQVTERAEKLKQIITKNN